MYLVCGKGEHNGSPEDRLAAVLGADLECTRAALVMHGVRKNYAYIV